jgi:hypothetical protein
LAADSPTNRARPFYFLSLGYLIVLLVAGIAYTAGWPSFAKDVPTQLGPVPIGVPWWGAVGAVVISLYGTFFHVDSWDASFDYWHAARPLLGAVLGTIAFLIFVVVIDATGVQAKTSGNLVYYVIAFLVGYREATFHVLIQRATDLLFNSPDVRTRSGTPPLTDKPTG